VRAVPALSRITDHAARTDRPVCPIGLSRRSRLRADL